MKSIWAVRSSYVFKNALSAFPLGFLSPNLVVVRDKLGEKSHQDIFVLERRYQGRFDASMMGGICWYLQRESKGSSHKRKAKCRKHF